MGFKKSSRRRKRSSKGRKLNSRQKKEVKQIIMKKIEHKYFNADVYGGGTVTTTAIDIAFGHADNASTGQMPIVVGNTEATRIGNQITPVSLEFRGSVQGGDYYNHIRLLCIRWYVETANSATTSPALGDILQLQDNNTGAALAASLRVFANYNYDRVKAGQIVVLYDKLFKLAQTNTFTSTGATTSSVVQTSDSVKTFRKVIKGKKLHRPIIYPSNSAAANNAYGGIYFFVVSDSAITPNPTIELVAQLKYIDA